MNFKSRVLPQNEVASLTGMECQTYQPRPAIVASRN